MIASGTPAASSDRFCGHATLVPAIGVIHLEDLP
jgi:hypothetical protein